MDGRIDKWMNRLGTLRNEDGNKDDGSCEKKKFSFSFSVLDHR